MGYAVIRTGEKVPRLLTMGVLDMRKTEVHAAKLEAIFKKVQELVKLYDVGHFAIEAPFYGKDAQAMLKLGRAQGAAMAAAVVAGLPISEYPSKSVKKAITGNGNASKEQVAGMLPHLVTGQIVAKTNDASDALAIAICHAAQHSRTALGQKRYGSWENFVKDNPSKIADT